VKQFFRMLLMALVLLTVALVSALTAMRFAIHGREVTIPKIIGMTPPEAERATSNFGLRVVVERQFYSPHIAEGKIMSQVPDAGTKVRRGWEVRVAQSLGPQRVAIPDVTGETERVAELNVRRRGLDIGSLAQVNLPDPSSAGKVVSQSPPPNASGVLTPKISMLVSDGPAPAEFVMPNFVGQPLGSATLTLQEAGLKLGRVSVIAPPPAASDNPDTSSAQTPPPASAPPSAASMIVTQYPAAGQKVVAGSAVNFEVR
jgi:eukaryotic-like serine/threonine-protein kinase